MSYSEPTAAALRSYLRVRPVTGTWREANAVERPLLGARRGSRDQWVHTGLRYHRVVMKPLWLARYVGQQVITEADPFGGPVSGGQVLLDALCALPGITRASNITGLLEPGQHHRLTRWVLIDPTEWPVIIPTELLKVVEDPWSTQ
jgi:hypothetical protein